METFYIIFIALLVIGVSNFINHFIPFIPVPLFQVALGGVLAAFQPELSIVLEPELFFVLFVAPLLFNDGKRVEREELWNLKVPILLLALGLVFATVFLVGYLINYMIPSMPLPVAFALAAILSPTDAVAVGALAGRINVPKNIMHLLEGEALMNDASGLVAFKFAIAATVTGVFSIQEATVSFFIIAIGGLLCGAVLAFLIIHLRLLLRRLGMEDVTMHMLLQILTPFVIYLVAEHLGVSGILAVVAGGIVHAIEKDRTEAVNMKMQIVSQSTWSVIIYILNGLVFVILGFEIPNVLNVIFNNAAFNNYQVIGYIVVISCALILLRFLWILLFSEGSLLMRKARKYHKSSLKAYILTSISGVRGAVTLAGAFSIPLVLQDGSPFPERDLIIFICAGVIIFTLIMASVFLPLFSDKKADAFHNSDKVKIAKINLVRYILHALRVDINDDNRAAVMSVISDYRKVLKDISKSKKANSLGELSQEEMKIHLIALKAEQQEISHMLAEGEIDAEIAYKMQKLLNHKEMLLSNRLKMRVFNIVFSNFTTLKHFVQKRFAKKDFIDKTVDLKTFRDVKCHTLYTASEAVKNQVNDENKEASLAVIIYYDEMLQRFQYPYQEHVEDEKFDKQKREIQLNSIQLGRDRVQLLYEDGEITRETAARLRIFINQIEAFVLEEVNIMD